jgi:hypothetical protein
MCPCSSYEFHWLPNIGSRADTMHCQYIAVLTLSSAPNMYWCPRFSRFITSVGKLSTLPVCMVSVNTAHYWQHVILSTRLPSSMYVYDVRFYTAGVSAVNTKHDCAVSDALVTVSGQSHCYRQGQFWIFITWKYYFLIPIHANKPVLSWALQINESEQNPTTAPNLLLTTIYNGPTNALVCNKTLIQMSHTKTLKITPNMFRSSDYHHQGAFWSWLKFESSVVVLYCVERHVDMSTSLSTQYNMQNEWTYAAA